MKLYLNFVSPNYGKIQISEPIGFDAFSFKLAQRKSGFGRDKSIGGAEIDLTFISGFFEKADFVRTLPNGLVVDNLTMGFDEILQAVSEKGSESKIEFIVEQDGNEFVNGLLDITNSTTDNFRSFSCSVVQDTQLALIERKKEIKADVFSTTDTFGNPQIPLEKTKILLQSKPTVEISEWSKKKVNDTILQDGTGFTHEINIPITNQLTKYGIKDSYAPFDVFWKGTDTPIGTVRDYAFANRLLTARELLTNVNVKIKKQSFTAFANNGSQISLSYVTLIFDEDGNYISAGLTPTTRLIDETENVFSIVDEDFEFTIPVMNIGESLYVWVSIFFSATSTTSVSMGIADFENEGVVITTTSTSIDSVILGVPYFDFLKQGIKSISGLELEANDIQSGEFSNQFVFNGNLIRQRNDKPLHFIFKDEMADLKEANSDYQLLKNKVEILQYPEFYPNIEIGAFYVSPDEAFFERSFNERFKDFSLEYNYVNFDDDKDSENTVDSVHTEAQFQHANEQVDNKLEISIKHIRDPFLIERMRREALKDSTALSSDDKIVLLDCVNIPSGTNGEFTAVLTMRSTGGAILEILGTSYVNWTLLGFKFADIVSIVFGENIGNYSVFEISPTVLKLVLVTGVANFSGASLITFRYPITDVLWTNRTNEGFDLIENVKSGNNFSNLKYTIKRNLSRPAWSSYLATINKDVPAGVIRNTFFKNNGALTTQFEGGAILTENANISVSSLSEKILNKQQIKTKIAIGFEQAKQLIEDIPTVKGFVRILDPNNRVYKIHPTMIDMVWRDGVMEIIGEERNESDFVTIVKTEMDLIINEVGYPQGFEWFRLTGDYLQIFDNRSMPLINPTLYSRLALNGITYTSPTELAIALNN